MRILPYSYIAMHVHTRSNLQVASNIRTAKMRIVPNAQLQKVAKMFM